MFEEVVWRRSMKLDMSLLKLQAKALKIPKKHFWIEIFRSNFKELPLYDDGISAKWTCALLNGHYKRPTDPV